MSLTILFQAAYVIARPFNYDREGTPARVTMSVATFVAVTILLPIQVCHFFYLKPGNIEEVAGTETWNKFKDNTFIYIKRNKNCYRIYFSNTFDSYFIEYYIMLMNTLAILLIVFAYIVIFAMILQSRKRFGDSSEEGRSRKKAQNMKIVKAALIMTSCSLLPWLPNLLISMFMERFPGCKKWLQEHLGYAAYWGMMDATNYLYYIVPWLFPLLNILTNPAIKKAYKSIRNK